MKHPPMMLAYPQLAALTRELHDVPVLSVYIDGTATDPASRFAWRQSLRNAVDAVHESLETQPKAARDAFGACIRHLDAAISAIPAAIGAPGWVGFFTADGPRSSGPVPTPMPTLLKWQLGAWVAPYVRALKQTHPVTIVLVDGRSAALYTYYAGQLKHVETIKSHRHGGHADHMGSAPREHFHGGTRGETASDAAEHARLSARDHMLRHVSQRIRELVGDDGGAIIGGAPEAAQALTRALAPGIASRVMVGDDFHVGASDAEITRVAERDSTRLRNTRDAAIVEHVLDLAGRRGRGVIGVEKTMAALSSKEGQQLLISPRFLLDHSDEAEAATELALNQGAAIEILSGDAAATLDAKAGGIAALLRFVRAANAERGVPVAH